MLDASIPQALRDEIIAAYKRLEKRAGCSVSALWFASLLVILFWSGSMREAEKFGTRLYYNA